LPGSGEKGSDGRYWGGWIGAYRPEVTMTDMVCVHCGAAALVKAGHNRSGIQRWQCRGCGRYTTLQPKEHGHGG